MILGTVEYVATMCVCIARIRIPHRGGCGLSLVCDVVICICSWRAAIDTEVGQFTAQSPSENFELIAESSNWSQLDIMV